MAHNETCAAIGNALWSWRMLQITGEARFADAIETVLHNAAMAGVSLDGTRFFYTNTLRQLDRMPVEELRWARQREPYISCFCCPPNVVRTIAEVGGYAYGRAWRPALVGPPLRQTRSGTTLGGGGRFRLAQETGLPVGGPDRPHDRGGRWRARLCRPPPHPRLGGDAALRVSRTTHPRRPGQARTPRSGGPGGPGMSSRLELPMPARLMQAHPLVEEARNQVAVQRGPLVYCVESPDLPDGVRVQDVFIPRGIAWTPRLAPNPRMLGGVTVLGKAGRRLSASSRTGPQLYRKYPRTRDEPRRGHSPTCGARPLLRVGQSRAVGDVRLAPTRPVMTPSLTPPEPHPRSSRGEPRMNRTLILLRPGPRGLVPRACAGAGGRAVGDRRGRPARAFGGQSFHRGRAEGPRLAG